VDGGSASGVAAAAAGRQRSTGRRAARVSSRRRTRVVCGAVLSSCGSFFASATMRSIAPAKASSVSRLSL